MLNKNFKQKNMKKVTLPKKILDSQAKLQNEKNKIKIGNKFVNKKNKAQNNLSFEITMSINFSKLIKTLSTSLAILLSIVLCFWTGFQLVNFSISKNAQAGSSGTTFGSGAFNNCSYNGSFCNTESLISSFDAGNTTSYNGTGQIITTLAGSSNWTLGNTNTASSDDPTFNSTGTKSFGFDGSQVIKSDILSNFSTSFSLETWFVRSSKSVLPSCQNLISLSGNSTNSLNLGLCGNSIIANGFSSTNSAFTKQTGFIPSDNWQHLVLTFDNSTNQLKIFVNGVLHSSSTQTLAQITASSIILGSNFVGQIAITRIYDQILNSSQITENFDAEKTRFNFTNSTINTILPTIVNFGNYQTNSQEQTVSILLDSIQIVDRRSNFGPYSANLGISNFGSSSNTIKRENVSISLGVPTLEMGSGLFSTIGIGGNLANSQNLLNNTANNGGGTFVYKPTLTLKIPPYSKTGNYTAVISVSVS